MIPQDITQFWFEEIDKKLWFAKSEEFDQTLRTRFCDLHRKVTQCEMHAWRKTPEGRLAEIIVLDQFSRNIFREKPESFAYDSLALALAQEAVAQGDDQQLPVTWRSFLYMPYMHSESLHIHAEALRLFSQPGLEFSLDFEKKHKVILDRFGRYPHRNRILGRISSAEELEFLQQKGSGF